jgi:hypothetical protein
MHLVTGNEMVSENNPETILETLKRKLLEGCGSVCVKCGKPISGTFSFLILNKRPYHGKC